MPEPKRAKAAPRAPRPARVEREAPVVSPLRGRIPQLPAVQAGLLRDFFAQPQVWALRDGGALRFSPGRAGPADATFVVDADGTPLAVSFHRSDDGLRDAAVAPAGEPDPDGPEPAAVARRADDGLRWSDYQGRARMLAWSLAHETQLMLLSDGMAVALLPTGALDDGIEAAADTAAIDAIDAAQRLWLGFSLETGNPDEPASIAITRGSIRLPQAWLPRLLEIAEQPFVDDPPPDLGPWRQWPAHVSIRLVGPQLAADEWQALRLADVIVAGHRTRPLQLLARGAGRGWPLAGTAAGWRVDGVSHALHTIPRESPAMNDVDPTANAPAASNDPDAAARALPVSIEFELGQLEMGLGELSNLQPGYVFTLPTHLEGANVTIRANGRIAGRGEVVAVGDTLGVRVLSWT